MIQYKTLSALRTAAWSDIPSVPGVYWWYFPRDAIDHLRIAELSDVSKLQLRHAPDGMVCLYCGMANNLAERIEWHAAQKLTLSALRSGFLSTFRFSLLALNDFDYLQGGRQIDEYCDGLSIAWREAVTRGEASQLERAELLGENHYPLNISGNRRPELQAFIRHLKSSRNAYKRRFLASAV